MENDTRWRGTLPVLIVLVVALLALVSCSPRTEPAGLDSRSPGPPPPGFPPDNAADAIQFILNNESSDYTLSASSQLVGWSREETAVVTMVAEAVDRAPTRESKADLVEALVGIWQNYRDQRAYMALSKLLEDPDVQFGVAVAFAQEGYPAGADVLRRVAHEDEAVGADEETLRRAQEARYWLRELGLQ